jgi:hypothetical protein
MSSAHSWPLELPSDGHESCPVCRCRWCGRGELLGKGDVFLRPPWRGEVRREGPVGAIPEGRAPERRARGGPGTGRPVTISCGRVGSTRGGVCRGGRRGAAGVGGEGLGAEVFLSSGRVGFRRGGGRRCYSVVGVVLSVIEGSPPGSGAADSRDGSAVGCRHRKGVTPRPELASWRRTLLPCVWHRCAW